MLHLMLQAPVVEAARHVILRLIIRWGLRSVRIRHLLPVHSSPLTSDTQTDLVLGARQRLGLVGSQQAGRLPQGHRRLARDGNPATAALGRSGQVAPIDDPIEALALHGAVGSHSRGARGALREERVENLLALSIQEDLEGLKAVVSEHHFERVDAIALGLHGLHILEARPGATNAVRPVGDRLLSLTEITATTRPKGDRLRLHLGNGLVHVLVDVAESHDHAHGPGDAAGLHAGEARGVGILCQFRVEEQRLVSGPGLDVGVELDQVVHRALHTELHVREHLKQHLHAVRLHAHADIRLDRREAERRLEVVAPERILQNLHFHSVRQDAGLGPSIDVVDIAAAERGLAQAIEDHVLLLGTVRSGEGGSVAGVALGTRTDDALHR
mmetsp:Transcript_99914/g.213930  ORF Transcript_99914/g.213930 Transcript_99914/m.213930 type:complete len:385 (+) Transcript_99914:408-1562(+)